MKCTESGVLPQSDYYFATPSLQAKSLFHYMLCVGHFICEAPYHVKRTSFNSVLLMYVLDGTCTVKINTDSYTAKKDDVVLLNCYQAHEYFTDTNLDILWLHFDGGTSMEFFDNINKNRGIVSSCGNRSLFVGSLTGLLDIFRNKQTISEPSVSCIIHHLLCNLVSTTSETGALHLADDAVEAAVQYIHRNITQKITVQKLAQLSAMSTSNFARLFKKEMGYSPYEYITKQRIDLAKKMLKMTSDPIAEIAVSVGFNSPSNFIAAFNSRVGLSPNKFRSMPF
ncbi:AraC family transcriptional regulator [Oscillospiraceae bacterium PP1C4]